MYNIISFSVWGNDKKYLQGCYENIHLAKEIYPGWICRFYCDSKVDSLFISKIKDLGSQVVIMKTVNSNWEGLFWRFLPASEDDVDIFISRDIDSRLNEREQAAVFEWLESDKDIHCMRDHIEHNVPILGGMWGCKKPILKDMSKMIQSWGKYDYKGSDQDFLRTEVWDKFKKQILAHDKFDKGFVIEQVVSNTEDYFRQRNSYNEYREKSILAKSLHISELKQQGLGNINYAEIDKIFPEIPELKPLKYNDDGNVVYDYVYDPVELFGTHDIRPFPNHKPMGHGSHVGEIIR